MTAVSLLSACSTLSGDKGTQSRTSNRKSHDTYRLGKTLREEIKSELKSVQSLSVSLQKLRFQYQTEPLKGPLTLKKLEDALIAEVQVSPSQGMISENKSSSNPSSSKTSTRHGSTTKPPVFESKTKVFAKDTRPSRIVHAQASSPVGNDSRINLINKSERKAEIQNTHLNKPSEVPTERPLETLVGNNEVKKIQPLMQIKTLENASLDLSATSETPAIFDIPVTYNQRVSHWIHYFQTRGRTSFRIWLERSSRFLPMVQYELTRAGLPQDLVYVAMIESGFSPSAVSHANAMGLWQFIEPTGRRYGLKVDWWIDERRDFSKATRSAIRYMTDLHRKFNSWYLVAASYNMGENGVARLIQKHKTNNFWELADLGALPAETTNYVPKIIAAMLISKAPALYGFRDLSYQMPLAYESILVPGGTDLVQLASHLGVSEKYLKDLNPELIKGFVPRNIPEHGIRIPKGSTMTVSQYIRLQGYDQKRN